MAQESKRLVDTLTSYLDNVSEYDYRVLREFFDFLISSSGSGDAVSKPQPATNNALVRFDGTTGSMKNSLVVADDAGGLTVPGATYFTSTINSTSQTTGSVRFSGGIGVTGNVFVGNSLVVQGEGDGLTTFELKHSGNSNWWGFRFHPFVPLELLNYNTGLQAFTLTSNGVLQLFPNSDTTTANSFMINAPSTQAGIIMAHSPSYTGTANVFEIREKVGTVEKFKVTANGTTHTLLAYHVNGSKVVGARQTGWTAATGTSNIGAFDTATATLSQVAERLKGIEDALTTHGLIGA